MICHPVSPARCLAGCVCLQISLDQLGACNWLAMRACVCEASSKPTSSSVCKWLEPSSASHGRNQCTCLGTGCIDRHMRKMKITPVQCVPCCTATVHRAISQWTPPPSATAALPTGGDIKSGPSPTNLCEPTSKLCILNLPGVLQHLAGSRNVYSQLGNNIYQLF